MAAPPGGAAALTRSARGGPASWLFALGAMPYGAFSGVVAVALPYLLRRKGVSVEHIASIAALVQAPAIWYVLWAPVVDLKLRRRTWILLLSVASGACVAAALALEVGGALGVVTALLVAASVLNQPVSSALGGLVASTVPNEHRGTAGGWAQAGILGGGIIAGAMGVWLSAHVGMGPTAAVLAVLIAVPALSMFAIHEPAHARADRLDHARRMLREILATLRRRDVWLAFAIFLSPVSAGALMNLFSAVAVDFHASADVVVWVVALAGVMTTVGAIAGGALLDRYDRWRMYPLTGLLSAAAAGAMLFAPLTPYTYAIGAAAYALATGFGYAAFMALALELLGTATDASSTRFTLFMAAVNVPVVYMLRVDGLGHEHFGVRGMLGADAAANLVFGVILLAALTAWRRAGSAIGGRHDLSG